jgi:hypothetical protein
LAAMLAALFPDVQAMASDAWPLHPVCATPLARHQELHCRSASDRAKNPRSASFADAFATDSRASAGEVFA